MMIVQGTSGFYYDLCSEPTASPAHRADDFQRDHEQHYAELECGERSDVVHARRSGRHW
jgi:hypothetical protein